jgi:hypothetical protein
MQIATITDGRVVPIVLMEDPIIHDTNHPFCADPECECHEDCELVQHYITLPLDAGLLTNAEAFRRYWGEGDLKMNSDELWKSGINDEYCWEHEGRHNGGWQCLRCRLEVTLGGFFEALAMIIQNGISTNRD